MKKIKLSLLAIGAILGISGLRAANIQADQRVASLNTAGTKIMLGQDITGQQEGVDFDCAPGTICYVILEPGANILFDDDGNPYVTANDPAVTTIPGFFIP